jgi:type VII secretion-associated serine protease mycosin/type VII secretion protein EccB
VATKKDLQQAQAYSRQRVLTAFTSGIPGGKELEPSNPMRTVIAAVSLAILIIVGSLIFGLIKPGLPSGWDNDKLLLSKDTGARYVSKEGTLYPVLNTTSARLVIPAADYDIVTVDESRIAQVPRGETIGILGAPDELPTPARLVQTGWSSCVVGDDLVTSLQPKSVVSAFDGATLVSVDGADYLVSGSHSYSIPASGKDAILRQLGLGSLTPLPVTARWLALFDVGTPIAALSIPGTGGPAPQAPGLKIGMAVHPTGTPTDNRFVVTADGSLAELSPFAYQLYLLGAGAANAVDVSPTQVTALPNATTSVSPADWPSALPDARDLADGACVTLDTAGDTPAVHLAVPTDSTALAAKGSAVSVVPSGGALVKAIGTGNPNTGQYAIIDGSGTAYPIPNATSDILARLGYTTKDVAQVPQSWVALFPSGPDLTTAAAGSPPVTSGVAPAPSSSATPSISADALLSGTIGVDADSTTACTVGKVVKTPESPPALPVLQDVAAGAIASGAGVTVAIVDSGVDASNIHLSGVVEKGINLVPDGAASDGRTDSYGHGTAIAGLVAAQRVDGSGVVGLAPGAKILPVRVFASTSDDDVKAGFGPDAGRLAQGIRWAADHGASVINVSLSDTSDQNVVHEAVTYATNKGALVVASAGNSATAEDATNGPRYPANYPEVLGVTAVGANDIVSGSISGPQVDVSAPGQNILTSATGAGDCEYSTDAASSSFATGYASAAAALIAQEFPSAGPAVWKYRLEATASRPSPERRDDVNGWGLIQPYNALTAVLDGTTPGPANPTATAVPVKPAAVVPVPTSHVVSPLERTTDAARWIGVVGVVLLAILALVARLRRQTRLAPGDGDRPVTT